MSLLGKLKSLFGSDPPDRDDGDERDAGVTIERERDGQATGGADESTHSGEPDESGDSDGAGSEATATDDDEGSDVVADDAAGDDPTAPDASADGADASDVGTGVEEIKGIGPTYADRLGEAGVDTVDDLASADAAELAAATDISEARLENWIEQAEVR